MKTDVESTGTRSQLCFASARVTYPFAAVMGHTAAKQALLLLAIEPGLRGALIASESGSVASTLARSFGALVTNDPDGGVVELPINVTEDRLLGGLDLDRTIATGKRQISTGLLARANGQVLYVNDMNLLDSSTSVQVAHALDTGHVRVEREGLSTIHDSNFSFIGTFNPDEGEPGSLLRDRVALIVDSAPECAASAKVENIERAFRFERDPLSFADEFVFETAQLKSDVEDARRRLPRVRVTGDQIRQISRIAIRLGVEGNRPDVFAVKAARASAALAGRDTVSEDDLIAAVRLVLVPRAITLPSPKAESEDPGEASPREDATEENRPDAGAGERESVAGAIEDVIIQALEARVPKDLLSPMQRTVRMSRAGKRSKASGSIRGRYARSAMRRPPNARIAIDATLRAAAPFQISRRALREGPQRESPGAEALARRVRIQPGDLRFKEFKHRSGILFIFAVDASGSMALNRMAQAKGAITRLLQQAYLHRDRVALISFRGKSSEALLAPTRSVELAKRLADAMPVGGGTPLAAGIVKAMEVARLARLRGVSEAMLVLFTDGRANVGLGPSAGQTAPTIAEELRRLGALLRSDEITSVVVDTKSRFVSSGEGEALARTLGARYFYLPRSDAKGIYDAIAAAADLQR